MLGRKTKAESIDDIPEAMLSEAMIKRDNYFHSCWMELKRRNPALWEMMTEVEMYIAGLEIDKDEDDKDESNSDDKEPSGTVL